MRNRAFLKVALLGLVALALVPGLAMASPAALSSESAARAAVVSGPIINVTPLGHDYGTVNVGSSASFCFSVSNTGDADLHVSSVLSSDPQFASASAPTVAAGGSALVCVAYSPTMGGAASASISIASDAANDPHFSVNVTGAGNTAPVLDPIGNKTAFAFVALTFDVTATDGEGDVLSFSALGLPVGATFDTNTGHFDWTPSPSDAGPHAVTFGVSDGNASDSEGITITVSAGNNPPVANPGGPYSGATGLPIAFSGSGSSDPDGNALSYAWDFGDGGTATGATPSHTYTVVGSYLVTLTVTDNGTPSLSASASTSASVLDLLPVQVTLKLGFFGFGNTTMWVWGFGYQAVGLEEVQQPVTTIDPLSVKMSTTYPNAGPSSEVPAETRWSGVGDLDGDYVPELVVYFSRVNLRKLLKNVPNNTTVHIIVSARTVDGVPVRGERDVKITNFWWPFGPVSAIAAPNPFNPETKVSFTLRDGGPTTVRIYSVEGRLVRTLHDGFAASGVHEVRWNGQDNAGRSVRSGVYFLNVQSTGGRAVQKLYLVK